MVYLAMRPSLTRQTRIGAFTEKGYFSQADPNGPKRNRLRRTETLVCSGPASTEETPQEL